MEEMEQNLLQRIYPFTKWVADTYRILPGWKKHYGNKDTRTTKANDRMAFMTISNEGKQGNEKKEVTFYKCRKSWTLIQ